MKDRKIHEVIGKGLSLEVIRDNTQIPTLIMLKVFRVEEGLEATCKIGRCLFGVKSEPGITVLEDKIMIGPSNYSPNIVGFPERDLIVNFSDIYRGFKSVSYILDQLFEERGKYNANIRV